MINDKIYMALTAVHPDGTHIVVPRTEPVETSEYWTSPVTGHRYPTRCILRAPQIETELTIEVLPLACWQLDLRWPGRRNMPMRAVDDEAANHVSTTIFPATRPSSMAVWASTI